MKDFFDGLLDTDKFEKVPSRLEGKNHTLFITKMAKIDGLFMTKNGWKTTAFEAAYTYIARIREYLPPRGIKSAWCEDMITVMIIQFILFVSSSPAYQVATRK